MFLKKFSILLCIIFLKFLKNVLILYYYFLIDHINIIFKISHHTLYNSSTMRNEFHCVHQPDLP